MDGVYIPHEREGRWWGDKINFPYSSGKLGTSEIRSASLDSGKEDQTEEKKQNLPSAIVVATCCTFLTELTSLLVAFLPFPCHCYFFCSFKNPGLIKS